MENQNRYLELLDAVSTILYAGGDVENKIYKAVLLISGFFGAARAAVWIYSGETGSIKKSMDLHTGEKESGHGNVTIGFNPLQNLHLLEKIAGGEMAPVMEMPLPPGFHIRGKYSKDHDMATGILLPVFFNNEVNAFLGFIMPGSKKKEIEENYAVFRIIIKILYYAIEDEKKEREALLSTLTKNEKIIFNFYAEGMTSREIAKKKNIHLESLYVAANRIKKKLRLPVHYNIRLFARDHRKTYF